MFPREVCSVTTHMHTPKYPRSKISPRSYTNILGSDIGSAWLLIRRLPAAVLCDSVTSITFTHPRDSNGKSLCCRTFGPFFSTQHTNYFQPNCGALVLFLRSRSQNTFAWPYRFPPSLGRILRYLQQQTVGQRTQPRMKCSTAVDTHDMLLARRSKDDHNTIDRHGNNEH